MAIRPGLTVLYVSGYTDETIGHYELLDQGSAFLHKPFTREELAQKVYEVVRTRNQSAIS